MAWRDTYLPIYTINKKQTTICVNVTTTLLGLIITTDLYPQNALYLVQPHN